MMSHPQILSLALVKSHDRCMYESRHSKRKFSEMSTESALRKNPQTYICMKKLKHDALNASDA